MKKFIYQVKIRFENNIVKVKGFYDTGNNFTINNCPVIFMKSDKCHSLGGISSFDSFYKSEFKKAELQYKANNKWFTKTVFIKEVNKDENFFGCDCLLNSSIF
jgi:hypothetical protein